MANALGLEQHGRGLSVPPQARTSSNPPGFQLPFSLPNPFLYPDFPPELGSPVPIADETAPLTCPAEASMHHSLTHGACPSSSHIWFCSCPAYLRRSSRLHPGCGVQSLSPTPFHSNKTVTGVLLIPAPNEQCLLPSPPEGTLWVLMLGTFCGYYRVGLSGALLGETSYRIPSSHHLQTFL